MNQREKPSNPVMASLAHISTFSKYIIPLGNFVFPAIIWSMAKKDRFVEDHARQALNFQISIFLYAVFIISTAVSSMVLFALGTDVEILFDSNFTFNEILRSEVIPVIVIGSLSGFLLLALFILELVSVLTASMRASGHNTYRYPISIAFIKSINQSKNEQSINTKNESL